MDHLIGITDYPTLITQVKVEHYPQIVHLLLPINHPPAMSSHYPCLSVIFSSSQTFDPNCSKSKGDGTQGGPGALVILGRAAISNRQPTIAWDAQHRAL
jgi:hypothetical protein